MSGLSIHALQASTGPTVQNPTKLYWWQMDVERTISEIESLEEMYEMPDIRPLNAADILAANQRHDKKQANSPWFRIWQHYGVCCRSESPALRLGETEC
jgi:hypothetical protein